MVRHSTGRLAAMSAVLALLPAVAGAQTPQPVVRSAPAAQPATPPPPPLKTQQFPVTLQDSKSQQQPEVPAWSAEEVAAAKAACAPVLAKYGVVATEAEEIKDGECGTAYPLSVTRVANVEFSHPAVVNCKVLETIGEWLRTDVQASAKRHLGARVVKIGVMSSYSCRKAYGRKKSRLSEHGLANALDVGHFEIDKGPAVALLADWGLTERDIKARIAAAEAAARKLAEAKAKADAEARARAQNQPKTPPTPNGVATMTPADRGLAGQAAMDGLSALRGMIDSDTERGASGLALQPPSRLGGPKAKQPETPAVVATPPMVTTTTGGRQYTARQLFLREIYDAACKRFGTTLGPEANEAHRNHFHLDMADRGNRGNYCR
jgi:hypothetical protein